MENSPAAVTIPPVLLRNLLTSAFNSADNSLLNLAEKYNLHQFYRLLRIFQKLMITSFLFFLGILPSFFSFILLLLETYSFNFATPKSDRFSPSSSLSFDVAGDSGLGRLLTQLLILVNDVPVSSRKYELVRSLAEIVLDENHSQGFEALTEINRRVLSAAFARALGKLEAATAASGIEHVNRGIIIGRGWGSGLDESGSGPVCRAVRFVGEVVWERFLRRMAGGGGRYEYSAEKMAAEVLWLAQKMAACEIVEEAVCRWASASNLASLALSADPRLQGSLVKVSAFLIKQAKALGGGYEDADADADAHIVRQRMRMNMLVSWLPLLCRASNGTDVPVLSSLERGEVERVLEETIETLGHAEQEKVLSLWLHHFTHCSNSDWPNLRPAFLRWSAASRELVVLE